MSTQLRLALSAFALLLAATDAHAFCTAVKHYINVGATSGTGTGCSYTYADLQTAINNVVCPNTVITIFGGATLANVALDINGKTGLTILGDGGGGTTCNVTACDPTVGGCSGGPKVTLQGTGSGSVFYIHGYSNVALESLTVTKGGGTDFGGGIHFTGTGSLTLVNSTITNNSANSQGGGIQFNGGGGAATLTLGAGTLIDENVSYGDGGGIHINGTARLFALQPTTLIGYNQAPNGYGGGIAVIGPARIDVGSPGYNGAPVIEYNVAAYGGGISAIAPDQDSGTIVRMFSTDPGNPVRVFSNSASHTGGGIYVKPFIAGGPLGSLAAATFCARDFRIDGNVAQEGTAVYADEDNTFDGKYYGASVYLNNDAGNECNLPETMSSLGAAGCAAGATCNTINDNIAEDSGNNPTAGATILAQTYADLQANRISLRGNHGAHVIRSFGPEPLSGSALIADCLIADNVLTAEMIRVDNDGNTAGRTTVDGCTIVNNSNQGAPVIFAGHPFTLTRSIVDEAGLDTLHASDLADRAASYVLATDIFTLPDGAGLVAGQPTYVDAANHDYHLLPPSLGVDFAPKNGGSDLDGRSRDVDLSEVANLFGPRDIGAYELQYVCSPDTIYCNGFEGPQ